MWVFAELLHHSFFCLSLFRLFYVCHCLYTVKKLSLKRWRQCFDFPPTTHRLGHNTRLVNLVKKSNGVFAHLSVDIRENVCVLCTQRKRFMVVVQSRCKRIIHDLNFVWTPWRCLVLPTVAVWTQSDRRINAMNARRAWYERRMQEKNRFADPRLDELHYFNYCF